MTLPTPRSKSAKRSDTPLPRAHVVFWRAFPNKELYPVDPEGRHKYIYNLEHPGTGASTLNYYLSKGYRIIGYKIDMPQSKMGPIIEELLPQLQAATEPGSMRAYHDAAKAFKPEMIESIIDETEAARRENMNALLRNTAKTERMKEVARTGKGGTVAEVAGVV